VGKINWGRVFLGGLVAGVVANVVVFASWFLFLGKAWMAALQEIGRPTQETTGGYVFWIVLYFVMGITAVWLYAAIRPRFSPGAKTALIAGFAYWVLGDLLPTVAWGFMTKLSTALLAEDALTVLVATVLATLAGAWVYKEA
jgi:hypothetical protein